MNINKFNNICFKRVEVNNESVLDPVNKTRCKDIFDDNEVMKSSVKEEIMKTLNTWVGQNGIAYTGVFLIGSSSGFQYTDYVDMDVMVYVDVDSKEKFKSLYTILPNGNLLSGTAHPINYYIIDINREKYDEKSAENIYDILKGKWVKKTVKAKVLIPFRLVNSLSRTFTYSIDHILSEFEKYKFEYNQYKAMDLKNYEMSDKEWNDTIKDFESKIRDTYDALRLQLQVIHSFQNDAFKNDNPFKVTINYTSDDPRFSMNNLIYKTLDRLGYKDKLVKAISEAKELIDKIDPENMKKG